MLFVGSFGHPPNIDAAVRLARDIFPGVRARVPEAILEIVGDAPPQAVRRLAGEGIVVTGRVADVRPHLDNAAVVAAPLRLGGGMRVKMLESLAAGKAMVATPRAVAGLGLEPGTHALIADGDGELSDALVSLLGDPELRRRMGGAARTWRPAPQLGAREGGVRRALRVPSRQAGRRCSVTRPRVAFVGWRLGGELERVIALGHERFDYTVVSMDLDEALRPLVEWRRMRKPMFGSFRLGWVAFFAVGGLRLARIDADLVHAVGPVPVVPNGVDLNTVTWCHASYDEATAGHPIKASSSLIGWKLGQRFTLALERWWFRRRVRVLLGLSEGSAADLRRFYPSTRVAVMPRGIDLQRFKPDDEDRRQFREEQGVPPAAVVALFVDQQHRPHKGLEVAIKAFAGAGRSGAGPDLLWVVGAGNEPHAALADQLGVGKRVRFLGHTPEVERYYRAADLFVLPTVYEALCRAAHEAAACGLPVVAPPVHGIMELVGDDEAGIIAERNPADFARALVALSSDPARRARMGETARRRALPFEEQAVAGRIIALHESLLC